MTSFERRRFLALGPLTIGVLMAPGALRAQSPRTLADTMAGDTRFARFLDLITRANAVESFRQPSAMTVFAPVDQAFAGTPAGLLQDLFGPGGASPQNQNQSESRRVTALIQYHMVPGIITPEQLSGGEKRLNTVNGADILVSGTAPNVTLRNPAPAQQLGSFGAPGAQLAMAPAQIVGPSIRASNGVIYPISQILWP